MGKINSFEDLKCWQASRRLVKEVFMEWQKGKTVKDYDTDKSN